MPGARVDLAAGERRRPPATCPDPQQARSIELSATGPATHTAEQAGRAITFALITSPAFSDTPPRRLSVRWDAHEVVVVDHFPGFCDGATLMYWTTGDLLDVAVWCEVYLW